MISGCFMQTSGDKTTPLSKLTVVGYQDSDTYKYAYMVFSLTFQIRKTSGAPDATYEYSDVYDVENDVWQGGVWKDADTGVEITSANDIYFPVGKGFWLDCPDLEDCEGFTLQSSGQVIAGTHAFELNAGGKVGVCNVMPVDTTLSKIEVQGYEDSDTYKYAYMVYSLTMQKLKTSGAPDATYEYSDVYDVNNDVWQGGVWKDADTGEEITAAKDVEYPAGKGFWVDAPDLEDCTAFSFVFPKCID